MTHYIYYFLQLRDCPENAPRLFLSLEATIRHFDCVDLKRYEGVHCGEIDADSAEVACEKLFTLYNSDRRPADYKGRSMSVSDIVILDTIYKWGDDDQQPPKYIFFCDSIGFRRLV